MSSVEVGSLEAAALQRKQRLAQLRAAKEKKPNNNRANEEEEPAQELPKPIFRSYKPIDEGFSDTVLPVAEPPEVEDKVRDELEHEKEGLTVENLDFTNLAPRKPDWDLKRDIAPKLSKLDRRTQKAIAELIRERLKKEDLANAVSAGASATQKMVLDEDD